MAERRLFEDVADTIRRLILDGTYPPGTRLPGERELSERFEVSRVTIREALHAHTHIGQLAVAQFSERDVRLARSPGFHHQPTRSAGEIDNRRAHHHLPSEAIASALLVLQTVPQQHFRL